MTEKPTCETCRFWAERGGEGDCQRYPPLPMIFGFNKNALGQPVPIINCVFPRLAGKFWCGEHEPKLQS